MASSFEKSVKGATKVKLAAPKSKYVEHILIATHAGEAGVGEVFRALNHRLKDQTWTIVFKSLIIVHLMIREGQRDVTLQYLRKNPRILAISNYTDAQEQGRNIRHYAQYLHERAIAYGSVKIDYVRSGEGRLRKLSVEKGLLREVECVQKQLKALLKCSFLENDVDNEITLTAFRLLVMDLLVFFTIVNEGVINVLEHYFEMSHVDAKRALEIYKTFTKQTSDIVTYLQQARRLESSTRLQIPNLKHAPTSLTAALEEYLNDSDFEINRRQYLAQQEAKKNSGKTSSSPVKSHLPAPEVKKEAEKKPEPAAPPPKATEPPKAVPDLIDIFGSIETEQTSIFPNTTGLPVLPTVPVTTAPFSQGQSSLLQQPFAQPLQPHTLGELGSFSPYSTSNLGQLPAISTSIGSLPTAQPDFTGQGFGSFTSADQMTVAVPPVAPILQPFQLGGGLQQSFQGQGMPLQFPQTTSQQPLSLHAQPISSVPLPKQDTNPFRQSMMSGSSQSTNPFSPSPFSPSPPPKSTNPFAKPATSQQAVNSLAANSAFPVSNLATTQPSPFVAQTTGAIGSSPIRPSSSANTNPFTRNLTGPQASTAISTPTTTAATLAPAMTGTNPFRQSMMQQQQHQRPTIAWEQMPTIPVFPRPNGDSPANGSQQQQPQW